VAPGEGRELGQAGRIGRDDAREVHELGEPQGPGNAYAAAGIRTDHEATSAAEALEKIRKGMTVLIRERRPRAWTGRPDRPRRRPGSS
jgi:hypothetical protein